MVYIFSSRGGVKEELNETIKYKKCQVGKK